MLSSLPSYVTYFDQKTLRAAHTFNSSRACIPPAWGRGCSPAAPRHGRPWRPSRGPEHISSWLIALPKAIKSRHFTHIQSQSPQVTGMRTEFILDVSVSSGCPESWRVLQSAHLCCPFLLKIALQSVPLLPFLLFFKSNRALAR